MVVTGIVALLAGGRYRSNSPRTCLFIASISRKYERLQRIATSKHVGTVQEPANPYHPT